MGQLKAKRDHLVFPGFASRFKHPPALVSKLIEPKKTPPRRVAQVREETPVRASGIRPQPVRSMRKATLGSRPRPCKLAGPMDIEARAQVRIFERGGKRLVGQCQTKRQRGVSQCRA